IGARWAGMAGACIATVDDGSAAWLNPAGLGKIRRIELVGTLVRSNQDIDVNWFGVKSSSSVGSMRFQNISISYPFPTYRGSFVLSGSVVRTISYDQYLNRFANPNFHDIEERKAVVSAWIGAFSVEILENTFLGAELHGYSGIFKSTESYSPWSNECEKGVFAQDGDLSGYGATIGMVSSPYPLFSAGFVVRTPQRITFKGNELYTETDDGHGGCKLWEYPTRYDIDLPYSFGFGMAVTPLGFILGADMFYTDWRELECPLGTRDSRGNYLYDQTLDIRVGVEYTFPQIPIRLRGGWAYLPQALNLFDMKKDENRVSLGFGAIAASSLSFDLAWIRSSFEREIAEEGEPDKRYFEKRTTDRALFSLAYRF
ncbi:MAG: OmpP1/FadL family transporter, partial [bacterium]